MIDSLPAARKLANAKEICTAKEKVVWTNVKDILGGG